MHPRTISLDYNTALEKARHYCAIAERCVSQVRRKLRSWGLAPEQEAQLLVQLVQERFVDEARYARAYSSEKHRLSGWGLKRISSELLRKGLTRQDIEQALTELAEEENYNADDMLRKLLERKLRTIPSTLDRRKAWERLVRFGLYRGYDYEDVSFLSSQLLSLKKE